MVRQLRMTTARLWLCALVLCFVGQLRHSALAQTGTLTLTQPTYDCSNGAIIFNTVGGNGTPITYSAAGITRDNASSNSGVVEAGLRADPKPIVITATQSGISTSFTFNLAAACGGGGSNFAVVQPTYNCATGAITFNTTGGNGGPITFTAPGITRANASSNTGTVEAGLRVDPKPIVITATQGGFTTSYVFDLAAFCASNPNPPAQPPVFSGTLTAGAGTVGSAFNYTLPTGAFTDPNGQALTYSATGLPAGLSINPATGAITGTPSTTGTSTVTIQATNASGLSTSTVVTINVAGTTPPTAFSGTLGSTTGTVGQAFSYTLPANSFTTTTGQSRTFTAAGLPAGLTINQTTGAISGTPTAAGSNTVIITATSSATSTTVSSGTSTTGTSGTGTSGTATVGQTQTATLGILINSSATSGTGTSGTAVTGTLGSVTGTVGQAFSYTIPANSLTVATGQSRTFTASGLPAGLTINQTTGAISGTPTTAGNSLVTISAVSSGTSTTVSSGTSTTGTSGTGTSGTATVGQTQTATLGIVINSSATSGTGTSGTAVVGSLGSVTGTVGQAFSYTLPATSFTATAGQSRTFTATSLPAGLTINQTTGAITGTPTTAGNTLVTITATSSATSTTVSSGTSTTGTSGTGTSGTATAGQTQTATLGIVINSSATSGTTTAINLGSVSGVIGQAFSYTLPAGTFSAISGTATSGTATGGQSLTYNASGVPLGLSVNSGTGAITGTPSQTGNSAVVIFATNSGGQSASALLGVTISSSVTSGTSTTGTSGTGTSGTATVGTNLGSVSGVVGQAFTYTIPLGSFSAVSGTVTSGTGTSGTATGGQALTYSATNLPAGLTINQTTGTISGTPTTAGSSTVVILATAGSSSSGTSGTSTSGTATVGQSASGTLGITISSSVTSGTSTTGTSGTGTSGTATVGTLGSATGVVGRAFSYTLPAGSFAALSGTATSGTATSGTATSGTGTTGQSLSYTATGLPAGLTINQATGAISGTPTAAGSSTVVIVARTGSTSGTTTSGTGTSGTGTSGTSTVGQSASATLTITISASTAGGRTATVELAPVGIIAVSGNPISNGIVEVAVTGVEGEAVQVLLTNTRGEVIGQQRRERAQSEERFRFDVSRQPAGTLLFRAATPTRANTIRLLKID